MTQIPPAAQSLLSAAVAASRNHDSVQALDLFAQAAQAAPGWALPPFLMGSEHASLGQWDKAEAHLAQAVLLEPALHIARYQLGLLQFSSGRAAVALVTWQQLVASCDEPGLVDFVHGFAALASDAFEEASRCFHQGLAAQGVNPAVATDIQRVLDRMPDGVESASARPLQSHSLPAHVLVANYGKVNLH